MGGSHEDFVPKLRVNKSKQGQITGDLEIYVRMSRDVTESVGASGVECMWAGGEGMLIR